MAQMGREGEEASLDVRCLLTIDDQVDLVSTHGPLNFKRVNTGFLMSAYFLLLV